MSAWTQLIEPGPALLILVLAVTSQVVSGAPLDDVEQSSEIEYYPVADATGCYYNFEHYDEGDRIITNEPCLNCTCHNRMLMCYLRVCPFTKAIGQDCKMEKKPDQCCPVITCPEVPVQLLPSASTTPSTAIGHLNEYGCSIDNLFYADGAKVPSNPSNPCEVCYCIRNKTACIIQECTLTGKVVEGCLPVYVDGVCCPVRYDCDHPEIETTPRPLLTTTTTTLPPTSAPTDCIYNNEVYADGALVKKDVPCEQCYCMKGDIVCAVQECGPTPLDKVNCTALPPKEGQCCPDTYECENISEEDLTTLTYYEAPTTQPTEILPGRGSTSSETEEAETTQSEQETVEASTIQGEKKETEKTVTESTAQVTEEVVQSVTESATVESFTSRITEAITSRVTSFVEALTTVISGPEQVTTAQPENQTSEPELASATEEAQEETITHGATKPELVTETISQETILPETQDPGVTEPEVVHDDHEEELPHEEENEIFEGSGKPVEEISVPSATAIPEEKPVSEGQTTTQKTEDESVTTKERVTVTEHVTEERSGLPEETPVEQQTTPGQREEGLQTIAPLEPESHVNDTVPPQSETEIGATTESLQEKLDATQIPPVTDAEAQETIQPLEPERSTEQTKPEKVHPGISGEPVTEEVVTEQPQEKIATTEYIQETAKSTEKMSEVIPTVIESQTTEKSEGEETESSATKKPVTETEQKGTAVPEEQKPESVTTTEQEELEIITEVPIKETERPESMDHISQTPESETEINVTEKSVEKEVHTTETAQSVTTGQHQISEEKTDVSMTEGSEICDDKGCKTKQDEKEIPGVIEESCTKEGCKPLEAIPTSPYIPGETIPDEKQKPKVEDCSDELGCITRTPDKETDTSATEKTPESATPCDDETQCKTLPGGSELQELTTEAATDETAQGTTRQPEVESKPDQSEYPEGSGEEPTVATEQTAVPESAIKPEDQTQQTINEAAQGTTSQPKAESKPEQSEYPEGSGEGPTAPTEQTAVPEPTIKPEDQTQQTVDSEDESKLVSTEGILAETTIKSDREKDTEITPAPESITSLPKESTSEETTSSEISIEKGTESPQEISVSPISSETTVAPKEGTSDETTPSEISKEKEPEIPQEITVSPISSETTVAPESIAVSTEYQKGEVPSYTVPPEEEKLTEESETSIPETTEQTSSKKTQTDVHPATESVVDSTHENIAEPEAVTPESSPVTEIGDSDIAEGTTQRPVEESYTTSAVEESQTTEIGIKLSEDLETEKPDVTKTPDVKVPSETTESIAEIQTQQPPEISEEPSGSEKPAVEHTAVPEQDGKTPALVTQSPEISEPPSTQQPESERTETTDRVIPQETVPSSETPETPNQLSSEETPIEIPQVPTETEVPVSATEPEIEITSESEEQHGIPGEGSCLVDGQTYKNNSQVPPINQCQTSCKCISSILQCESIPCAPPPSNLQCSPIFHSPDACCPVYSCSVPGVTSMESDSHVVETTTSGEEILVTKIVPSEETATPEVITEKEPSEAITAVPEVHTSASQTTTQNEIGTEIATGSVTEGAIKEKPTEETQTIVPVKHTTVVSEETTKPSEEQLPSRDEIENEILVEYPEHCGSDGCVPEENIPDTTASSVTQPQEKIPEPTESIKPEGEEVLTQTENVIPERSTERESPVTEQPQEEIKIHEITTHTAPTERSPEIATETASEEASKTPEEIAAAPEMEEAVTTPSISTETATDSVNQISKDSEKTTDEETVTEGEVKVTESDKSTTGIETDLTVRPLLPETTISVESQPTEGSHEPTVPSAVPIEHIDTTPTSEIETVEIIHEHVTELPTTPPLESEAHATETSYKESEKPKEFTEAPIPATEKSDKTTETPEQSTHIPVYVTQPVVLQEEEKVTEVPARVTEIADKEGVELEHLTEISEQVTETSEKESETSDRSTEVHVTDLPSKESETLTSITESTEGVTEAVYQKGEKPGAITEIPAQVTESVEKEGITEVPAVAVTEVTEKESEKSETGIPERATETPGVSEEPIQATETTEKESEQPEIPEMITVTETLEGVTVGPSQVTEAAEKDSTQPETITEVSEHFTETEKEGSEKPESVTEIAEHITKIQGDELEAIPEFPVHVTEASEKEDEADKDFTGGPATEIVPETTSHELELPTATAAGGTMSSQTDRSPEQEPISEEKPSKTSESEAEVTTVEATTPESETSKPKFEGQQEVTEIPERPEVATTESKEEEGVTELGEFPTHASIPTDTTETAPVTEIKQDATTGVPTVAEGEEHATSSEGLLSSKPTEESIITKGEEPVTADKEESVYTSPQLTTLSPSNATGLYTSGPKVELSTRKSVEGELSTSVPITPVSTSSPSTSSPTYAPAPAPGHDIPGEQVPELPDYHSPGDDYEDEDQSPLGPGTCRYGGKVYVSAQQIPRDDPCDFCFCFRSDIICLQQSCPPPIPRCHEEPIRGFCCPRYECPVGMATAVNVTTSTTTTTTTLPPHFLSHAYTGRVSRSGCQIKGRAYKVGEVIPSASGPCLHCTCGGDGEMKCDPKACSPEPMLRQMIAAAASRRRR